MPLELPSGAPTLFIRREAYERAQIVRTALDTRLALTPDEFRVQGNLVAVGPVHDNEGLQEIVALLEQEGLEYFEDFFELSGNWPEWLRLHASS